MVSRAAFQDLRERYRVFDEALLLALCGHMRTLSIYMGDASLDGLTTRMARRLADLTTARRGEVGAVVEMSQAELAAALGVSRQTVISIEGGRYLPSLPLAFTIARFFGLTVDKMFDPDEEEAGT